MEEAEDSPDYILDESSTVDYMIIYALAVRFIRPFHKWKAFEMGLIDKDGKVLRAPKSLKEKSAFTPLDNIILKIKKLIPKRLWYLLTAAYIFKGFLRTSITETWEATTEEEIIELEERDIKIEEAYNKIRGIIDNGEFTEEEFWNYVVNKKT